MRPSKRKPSKMKTGIDIEVRDPDDELVTHVPANVHIERMDKDHWWMRVHTERESVDVNFTIVDGGKRIHSTMVRYR